MAAARRGSWYRDSSTPSTSNTTNTFLGINMSGGNTMQDGGAGWSNSQYQGYHSTQMPGPGYVSPSSSTSSNQHVAYQGVPAQQQQQQQQQLQQQPPALHKRPSNSQMQGVVHYGNGTAQPGPSRYNQAPSSPGYHSSASIMSPLHSSQQLGHAGSQSGMSLSPGLRPSTQGSATSASGYGYDQSRMAFSPVMQGGGQQLQQQQQQPPSQTQYFSAPNSAVSQNPGLGVSSANSMSGYHSAGPAQSAGPSSPFAAQTPVDHRQQQQPQQGRPSNLLGSSAGHQYASNSSHASSSSGHPALKQFNRSNSSTSGALSISTSPTTVGQASPMTPSSPAGLSNTTARGTSHQQQQQYAYSNNHVPGPPAIRNNMSPLEHQMRRPSTHQQASSSSLSNYSNASQTPEQTQAQAQYAAFLDDPMGALDRRIGSYSPSHYAVTGGAPPQFAGSPYPTTQQQAGLQQSPRQVQGNAYFSPSTSTSVASSNLPQSVQQQQQGRQSASLSPSYSRQGHMKLQPVASSSMVQGSPSSTSSHAYSPAPLSSAVMKPYHSRSESYSAAQPNERQLTRRRPRSTGSAFRQVRNASDLHPSEDTDTAGRRADPDGGVVSPLKALTTQLSQTYHLINPTFRYEFSLNPRRVLTKPSKPCGNNGYDNEDSDYILYVNDVLGSEGNKYLILDVLGQGTFGQVVKCQNLKTHEIVGVKVIKNKEAYAQQSTMEIMILDILNGTYDPHDKHHILRLKDSFTHQKHLCLVFELLSSNLYELIKQNSFRGLSLSLVRVFTEQLLDALCVLKDAKLIHCDLKPENILLKTLQSPDIKVIDFGSACHEKQTVYTYIQSRFYRSPEVLLGLPYSTSIDMWSLGCICVELFLGLPLFPGTSEFNQITRIVEMLGLPPTYMLESGKQVHNFFNFYYDNFGQKRWQLKTLEEYSREHPNAKEQPSKKFFNATTLPDIIKQYPNQRKNLTPVDVERENQNRLSFIDFVSGLLNMNPMERWTPQQAKQHPFVQNKDFIGPFVPSMGGYQISGNAGLPSPRHKEVQQDRPYGGLPPTPARTSAHTYQDAAQYQQHLNQQQAHNAMATASAYRQAQYSNNPYALPASSMPDQLLQRQQQQPPQQLQPQQLQPPNPGYQVPKLPPISVTTPRGTGTNQHSPSQSMNMPSTAMRGSIGGPLSPNSITNPPQAHHYPLRGRSGTFSQMDVPPALQKLGLDLSSFKAIGTPQLRRDEQRAAWERRNTGNNELDRRRSLKQTNPHLEHLEYYAQTHPGNYYYPGPAGMQQPFSVVVDPRMSHQPHHAQAAAAVTVPPQAYSGQGGSYDAFDQFDARDGLNTMLHQPLLPTQTPSSSNYGHSASNSGSMHNGLLPSMGYAGHHQSPNANGENGMHSSGKQKRSDQQMFP